MKIRTIYPWFQRSFPQVGTEFFPILFERLQGTTIRIQDKILGISPSILKESKNSKWSVTEHIGHLSDLEPLWIGRVSDIVNEMEYMRSADLTNQKTYLAKHNNRKLKDIISDFASQRRMLLNALLELNDDDLEKQTLHPRLKTPMKMVDLMHFVAEHDDHHLAICSMLIRKYS